MSSPNGESPKHATIITFRWSDKLAYVPPPDNYEQAIKFARDAFKDQFSGKEEIITFRRNVKIMGSLKAVDITPMVWKELMSTLLQYEVIDVVVSPPDRSITLDVPPVYSETTKNRNGRLSPSHSRSMRASRSPSPSLASRAADWIGKQLTTKE